MRRLILGVGVAVAVSLPALAEAQEQKGFAGIFVGGTISSQGGGTYGGNLGVRANDRITIFGEFGRLTNLLPKVAADQIQTEAARVATSLGGSASPTAKTRTNYGMAGARIKTTFISGLNTFIEIGAGVGKVSTDLTVLIRGSETAQGDISNLVSTPFSRASATKPLVTMGGGIILDVTAKTAVEVGVGYMRVFTDSPALNAARVYGAYRIGF